jgi:hypothetical protein
MGKRSFGYMLLAVLTAAGLAVAAAVPPRSADAAAGLPRPDGEVVLTVTGNIGRTNSPSGAEFDRAMLDQLGITSLRTSTPWTEGEPEFKGVLVRDLLQFVGAKGSSVRAVALNDYAFEIEVADFRDYPVILASEMNGRTLTARDKGPLWVMYPLDRFSGRQKQQVELRMVWQLVELQVQ